MGFFNELIATVRCSNCKALYEDAIQFKFGHTRQLRYRLGDKLQWQKANDIGEPGMKKVKVYGIAGMIKCPVCAESDECSEYDIFVEDDVLVGFDRMGEYDYMGSTEGCYKVLIK